MEEEINKIIYTLEMHHIDSKPVSDLLEAYKQLEKVLEENTIEHIGTVNRLQELEKENKILIDTSRNMLDVTIDHYIPKSVIREKIEDLEEKYKKWDAYEDGVKINLLKELLGGSNE